MASNEEKNEITNKAKDVDLSAAGRGVWLVKVPKYLSERWKKSSGKCEVGKLKITRSKIPGLKPEVSFTLNETQAKLDMPNQLSAVPREHKFLLTGADRQNLVVFSEEKERIAIEGKVIQRAECRPVADTNYLKLKKLQMEQSNKPRREVVTITERVNMYKPVKDHAFNIEDKKNKKEVGKRIRQEKDVVMNKLFEVFEKHQYYNIQDLVRLTNQPIICVRVTNSLDPDETSYYMVSHLDPNCLRFETYLKEILKEICVYNVKAPHKNMWELKPEYRHYKDDK